MKNLNKILAIIIIFLIVGGVSAKTGNTIIGDSITNVLNISAERGDFNSLYELGERVVTWMNVSGGQKINQSITFIPGNNINLSQDAENKTITISGNDIAFEVIVNNTNLAPTFHAEHPGTGERIENTTYYANISTIELHVFAHADNVSETAGTFVFINGTLVSPRSGRPLGGAETAYRGVDITIPKGSYYKVDFQNYHHYEWREYQILSGRNGTLSINQTIITGDTNHFNLTNKSLSDHNITTDFSFNGFNITTTKGIYQQYSEVNLSILNNCQDSYPPDTTLYCPRTLQKLKTNYSNTSIRHRLNPANQNYGITLNYNESGYLDNNTMSGWGIFYRASNDDFYVGRFTGDGVAIAEFIWRCQNNASCTFYNNFIVNKNLTVNNLAGTGNNAINRLDSTGKLIRDEIDGYISGNVFLCFNATVGAYAC